MNFVDRVDYLLSKITEVKDLDRKLDHVDRLLSCRDNSGMAEQSFIDLPQKAYKPIDRLSRGMRIIKKLIDAGELPPKKDSREQEK